MPEKGPLSGKFVAAVRFKVAAPGTVEDEWEGLTIGDVLANSAGGTSTVYDFGIDEGARPAMVAKIFNDDTLKLIRATHGAAERITFLASNQDELSKNLPFCAWPRRLVTLVRPEPGQLNRSFIGFSMLKLEKTVSLERLAEDPKLRATFNERDFLAAAVQLTDALRQLHEHRYRFIFGDFNPRNIHIEMGGQRRIQFIDTDTFHFHPPGQRLPFTTPYLTPGFTSPGSLALVQQNKMLPRTHDEFVLAIHIFHLLMGSKKRSANPFDSDGQPLPEMIENRNFVYDKPKQFPLPKVLKETYASLPQDVRAAFTKSFTTSKPLSAREWGVLLASHWRSLLQQGSAA